MKKSELKIMIREEIQKYLNEDSFKSSISSKGHFLGEPLEFQVRHADDGKKYLEIGAEGGDYSGFTRDNLKKVLKTLYNYLGKIDETKYPKSIKEIKRHMQEIITKIRETSKTDEKEKEIPYVADSPVAARLSEDTKGLHALIKNVMEALMKDFQYYIKNDVNPDQYFRKNIQELVDLIKKYGSK